MADVNLVTTKWKEMLSKESSTGIYDGATRQLIGSYLRLNKSNHDELVAGAESSSNTMRFNQSGVYPALPYGMNCQWAGCPFLAERGVDDVDMTLAMQYTVRDLTRSQSQEDYVLQVLKPQGQNAARTTKRIHLCDRHKELMKHHVETRGSGLISFKGAASLGASAALATTAIPALQGYASSLFT